MPTFAEAARRLRDQLSPGWRSPHHARLWLSSLERHFFPRIGETPVSEVTSADVIGILAPIWHQKATTARKLRQRIRAVMEWTVAMELRADNPCDRIGPALGAQNYVVQHMRALPHAEVASAIGKVRASNSKPLVKLAFEFLVLTATRGGEVRGAAWTEIDVDHEVWTIPAPRTKTNREHRVPLSRRALEILGEARAVGRGSPLVFPMRGNPLSNTAMSRLLKRLGIKAVPHGFRSSFRDWAAEETDHPREVAEAALAHMVRNQVEAAYRRTDLFERRRRLMDDWGRIWPERADRRELKRATSRRPRSVNAMFRELGCGAPPNGDSFVTVDGSLKRNTTRQLPDTRTLHWPARSPFNGCSLKPGHPRCAGAFPPSGVVRLGDVLVFNRGLYDSGDVLQ